MFVLLARSGWPDGVDLTSLGVFLLLALGLPTLGYYFLVVDVRAWLRALRGVLVKVVYCFPELPAWARYETPRCLRVLGLRMPCTEADVKRAYRRLAEELHPDRGGDAKRFLIVQRNFEASLKYVNSYKTLYPSATE